MNKFPCYAPPWEEIQFNNMYAKNQQTVFSEIRKRLSYKREFFINNSGNKDYHGTGADAAQDVDHAPADVAVDKPEGLEVLHERKPCYKGKDGAEDLRFLGKSQQCVLVLTQKISHVHEQCGACTGLNAEREP